MKNEDIKTNRKLGWFRWNDDTMIIKKDFFEDYMKATCRNTIDVKSVHVNEQKKACTVVFSNGTHETVKCSEKDNFDPYVGIALCIAQRIFGSKTKFHKIVNNAISNKRR